MARRKPALRLVAPAADVQPWGAYEPGCCLRCGKPPAPLTECVLTLSWKRALNSGDDHGAQIGTYVLCDFCATTMRKCLENGTRLVPIVLEGSDDGGMYIHRKSVICIECQQHPPCICGRAT